VTANSTAGTSRAASRQIAGRREWIGLAVLVLPALLVATDAWIPQLRDRLDTWTMRTCWSGRWPIVQHIDSRPWGGVYVLDRLWRRLGIDAAICTALRGKRLDAQRVERILFALVANRALKPSSKLAATDWIAHDVHIDGLSEVGDDACYRAMDVLLAVETVLARRVYDQVADLLNLEVDLLFFDTTSTYFETEGADEPVARDRHGRVRDGVTPTDPVRDSGFRTHGHSKDHRDDLPQVVVGMAVTRTGIPVRCGAGQATTATAS
jgi:hypothetical protein